MSLKDKSDFSANAAVNLLSASLYAPSVHCSYYRCFQLLVHKLITRTNLNKQQFDEDCGDNGGTHVYAIKLAIEYLNNSMNSGLLPIERRDVSDFKNKIHELKSLRVAADYSTETIDSSHGYDAKSRADALVNFLNRNF